MNRSFRRVISAVMALVVLFGLAVMPINAARTDKMPWDSQEVYDNGYIPVTSHQFFEIVDEVNDAFEVLLGFRLLPEEKMEMTVNGYLSDLFVTLEEETEGILDCHYISQNFPAISAGSKEIRTLFNLDMEVLNPVLIEKAEEYFRNNNFILGILTTAIRLYLQTIESCELNTVPAEGNPGVYDVVITFNYEGGKSEVVDTGMIYDSVTGTLANRDGKGMLGLGFELDTNDYVLSTVVNSWQRNFGFMVTYDIFCYITKLFDYVTTRIHFTYDNKEWMVQIWKGNYLIAPGGEIGIYTREIGAPTTFYNCANDDEMMVMTMDLYHKDEFLFSLGPKRHWWLTGFKLHSETYVPESLVLHGSIEFPSVEMADLFMASAAVESDIEPTQDGAKVSFIW